MFGLFSSVHLKGGIALNFFFFSIRESLDYFFLHHNQTEILLFNSNTLILITKHTQRALGWEGLYPLGQKGETVGNKARRSQKMRAKKETDS